MRTLVIVNAGLSNPSTTRQIAEEIATATTRQVTAAGEGLEVHTVDLRGLASDLASFMTTFMPSDALVESQRTVTGADALIVATPVFQGSYSGLFKMFFDTLEKRSLEGIPTTMVATAGTERHSMVLDYAVRPLLGFLHAVVLPTGVFAATGEFGADTGLDQRIERAAGELSEQLTRVDGVSGLAGTADRNHATDTADTSDDFRVPDGGFASLLAGHTGN
ncbi:MAG TPA: NAD(P)H-dependent oxidoreductase [Candidatus Corynebacterium avicola]|uniref:NAD(P)H-dependent oxidoreductase n=1 Tax=Candidatus Corynebacterium avicola TaxID=2838527 RepID=A0A9D1RMQ5_9CORY|nr:NAD(P)H-dependent oxidoreductase [Candidatus Corynebacterium avicola]